MFLQMPYAHHFIPQVFTRCLPHARLCVSRHGYTRQQSHVNGGYAGTHTPPRDRWKQTNHKRTVSYPQFCGGSKRGLERRINVILSFGEGLPFWGGKHLVYGLTDDSANMQMHTHREETRGYHNDPPGTNPSASAILPF